MTVLYWHSTVPFSPSSYSVLTARVVPQIVRMGHRVILGTWYGLQGGALPWPIKKADSDKLAGVVQILPSVGNGNDPYGAALMEFNYRYAKADVMISCSDLWVFEKRHTFKTCFAPWFPVDFDPLPEGIARSMEPAIYPMVMSRWGLRVIEEAGLYAHYVPASAPAKLYTPGDKLAARNELFQKKTDFLVTMVNANKSADDRKGFAEGFLGFAKFLEHHPDALLYCHTNWAGPIDIGAITRRLGIQERVVQPDQYAYAMGFLGEDYMAKIYQASDVLLNTCRSEGFGLPLVEAQMCGTPIIAPDYSTTAELLFAGWKVQGQLDWGVGADSWRYRVFVDSVADALEEAYHEKDNRLLREQATNGARQYDNDIIFEQYWRPALAEIEQIVNRGKTVYDIAAGIDMVTVQRRSRSEFSTLPAEDRSNGLSARTPETVPG